MCGLCGSFTALHWSAGPVAASRPAAGRSQIAEAARGLAKPSGVKIAAWGQGFQVTGPTGRSLLAADLAGIWRAVDQIGRSAPDPLDPEWLDRLDAEGGG